SAQGYTEYGRFLMYANRNDEAEAQFQKGISIDGGSIDAREAIAEFYTNTKQLPKAEQAYVELVQIQDNSPESRLELADFYNKIEKKDQAIATLDQILSDSPTYVLARYKLAEIYLDKREPAKVSEQLDALLKINDEDTTALMLRAKLGLQQNKPEDAVKDIEEVLKKYPSDRDGLFLMAQARLAMGQVDHANAFIADLDRYHPNYLKTGLLKIQGAFAADDAQSALRLSNDLLDKSNTVQPDADQDTSEIQEVRIRAVTSRGLAFLALGNLPGAKAELEKVVQMSPRSAAAIVNLAKVSVAEKNPAAALDLYEKALTMDTQNFDAMSGIVASCIKLQQTAKAHDRLASMIAANGDKNDVLAALHYLNSTVFEAEKNDAAAETELRASIDLDNTYFTSYTAYAGLLARENRVDEAIGQYKAVLDKRPSAQVWTMLGILEDGRGNLAGAETAYRNALEITPETPIAANNLAWIISENGGNLDEALQLATMAVTKSPQSAGFYDTLGWIYLKKGLNSPAVEQMRKAVSMDEASAKANGIQPNAAYRVRLGMALAKYGDKESARREVETGLKNVSMLTQKEQTDARNTLASL
ncbi:MAG: tetratricopeptide repeat protein, partial [Acidobacteria bacterium]|nr:tetratricopeptide repeat protein [Acidobacteriota bacterium]